MPRLTDRLFFILSGFCLLLVLVACQAPTPTSTPTETATLTPEPSSTPALYPTLTATPSPFGSPDNPLVMGFVGQNLSSAVSQAQTDLASRIAAKTGDTVTMKSYPTYDDLLKSLASGEVQLTWLPPFTYLLARRDGLADATMVTNHLGVYAYGAQFLTNAADNYTVYFDPNKGQSTADAAHALRQFAGKRPCWDSPHSVSGYVVPLGVINNESIQVADPVVLQDATAVVRALYLGGICDFGATYAIVGDPRTATAVQKDLPDALQKVTVVWQTDPVIPNLNFSVIPVLPQSTRAKITDALRGLAQDDGGLKGLSDALNYQVADLKTIDDHFYDPLRAYVDASGVDLAGLVGN